MLDEKDLMLALKRHWDYSGRDEDTSHEIYHDDAVLEFPQSGERFEGVENFREWRRQYPAQLRFHTRRITHRNDLVVVATTARHGCIP
jgi:ketosteroid isomerase-like protein